MDIQDIIDYEEIKRLMAKYCHGIDKRDEEMFISIWAEDGSYVLSKWQASGLEEVRKLLHKVWREVPKTHHLIVNPLINLEGGGATAQADVIYYRQNADGTLQLLSGTYSWQFVKKSGVWKTKLLKFGVFFAASPVFEAGAKA